MPHEIEGSNELGCPYNSMEVPTVSPHEVEKRVHLFSPTMPRQVVAIDKVICKNSLKEVNGVKLGQGFWQVLILRAIKPRQYLMIPNRGVMTVGDAINKSFPWRVVDVRLFDNHNFHFL